MFNLIWQGFVNTILHYTLTFNTQIDRFVFMFLLFDLLIASIACILRELEKNYNITKHLCDQFNEHLSKRDKVLDATRKCFVFQKIRANHYSIIYFKSIGIDREVKKAQQDLIDFGIDKEIVEDDGKLLAFLQDVGQGKYDIKVNEKEKKFTFIRKEQDQEEG